MAVDTPPAPPPVLTPLTHTTRRGIATASFALGLWGTLVFWWYPFGLAVTGVALVLGLFSLAMGIRAGKDGENLALYGVGLALVGQGLAWASYRFMMLAFEGQTGLDWLPIKIDSIHG